MAAAVVLHLYFFVGWYSEHELHWYVPWQQRELAAMVEALPRYVPEGEAVASDFMTSTAILAHTGRPIVVQPKWETKRSRERVRRFWETFYRGTTEELRRLLVDEYRCRYLLVDRLTLLFMVSSRYMGGIPRDQRRFAEGSPARMFLGQDTATLRGVPGYELVWRSPATLRQSNGRPTDAFRLYRLGED